jgi:hypothetical protein
MTDPEAIDRRLAAARNASWAPADAQARIRANLAASGVPEAGSSADAALGGVMGNAMGSRVSGVPMPGSPITTTSARTGSVTKLTTGVLVGMSFVAGYWLGVHRASDDLAPEASRTTVDPTASATPVAPTAVSSPAATPPEREARSSRAASVPRALAESLHASRAVPHPPGAPRTAAPAGRAVLSRPPPPTPDPFADELSLLQRAERAIRSGEAPLAMSFLDELDRRFPQSTLSEERSAARVLAECALSAPDARRRAELFLRDREASVYSDRVRRLCELELSTPAARGADGSESPGH